MGDHWNFLRRRKLLELTLPGSHNSGNVRGVLSSQSLCTSDYRYEEYVADPSTRARGSPLSRDDFDRKFIPWNVNHNTSIASQLRQDGVRFFHLKIANMGPAAVDGETTLDLRSVVFQHRGYTTAETLLDTLADMAEFLEEHPREFLVLGLNNLHNASPGSQFASADTLALARSVVQAIGHEFLATKDEVFDKTLEELTSNGRRFAVFLKCPAGSEASLPGGVIASSGAFVENWDSAMTGGNLEEASKWLVQDLGSFATKRGRFYVMQANPNNSEKAMYAEINKAGQEDLEEASALEHWLAPFLLSLGALVRQSVAQNPRIRINAISTDFLHLSRPIDIALRLMGLPSPSAAALRKRPAADTASMGPTSKRRRGTDLR